MKREYIDDEGNYILEEDGWLFINGSCVAEPMSDEQCDRYAIDVQNGDGYYNSLGKFIRFS